MVVKRDEGFPTEDTRGLFNGTHVSFFTQEEAFPEDYMETGIDEEDEADTKADDEEEEEFHEEKEVVTDVIDGLDEEDELNEGSPEESDEE
jgi:hypothetical protein